MRIIADRPGRGGDRQPRRTITGRISMRTLCRVPPRIVIAGLLAFGAANVMAAAQRTFVASYGTVTRAGIVNSTINQMFRGVTTSGGGIANVIVNIVGSQFQQNDTVLAHGFGFVNLQGSLIASNVNSLVNCGGGAVTSLGTTLITNNVDTTPPGGCSLPDPAGALREGDARHQPLRFQARRVRRRVRGIPAHAGRPGAHRARAQDVRHLPSLDADDPAHVWRGQCHLLPVVAGVLAVSVRRVVEVRRHRPCEEEGGGKVTVPVPGSCAAQLGDPDPPGSRGLAKTLTATYSFRRGLFLPAPRYKKAKTGRLS